LLLKCQVAQYRTNLCETKVLIIHCDYLTNQLTPWSRVLEKVIVTVLVKKFPIIYGTQGFSTVFTRYCHWSLSLARCFQSTPSHPVSQRSILILSHCDSFLPNSCLFVFFPASALKSFHSLGVILHWFYRSIFAERN
jgi:hypothetical protein